MRTTGWILVSVATWAVALGACSAPVRSEAPSDGGTWRQNTVPADTGPADVGQPGPGHRVLDPLVGDWDAAITMWGGPDDEHPMKLAGSAHREWALEGHFLEERAEESTAAGLQLWDPRGRRPVSRSGTAYGSRTFLGYDRLTGLYEHLWMHDDSTRMYYKTGRYDPERKVISLSGTWTVPHNGVVVLARQEIALEGPDHHTVTRYISDQSGREFKDLEIRYSRKKAP